MIYNDIHISEDGFVTLTRKFNAVESSAFFFITPTISFITTPADGNLHLSDDSVVRKSSHFIKISTYGNNQCDYIVGFSDRTAMELAADDLLEAMRDRLAPRTSRSERRRYALRSVDIILLNPKCMPTQGTEGSAGYDCFADIEALKSDGKLKIIMDHILTLDPGQCALIPLGFKLLIGDPNYEARLVPRSGKGHKGLVLGNLTGTIDSDYEGVWMMSMWNRTAAAMEVNLNEAICQMVFDRVEHPEFVLVDAFESHKSTDRGDGGFGSTDIKRLLAKDN